MRAHYLFFKEEVTILNFENGKDADYAAEMNAEGMSASDISTEGAKESEPTPPPDPAGAALCVTSGFAFLVQSYVTRATECFELALHYDPESADAYLGLLLAENNLCSMSDLTQTSKHFWESKYYAPLYRLASPATLALLKKNRTRIEAEDERIRAEREARREKTHAFLKKHRVAITGYALLLVVLTTLSSLFFAGVFDNLYTDEALPPVVDNGVTEPTIDMEYYRGVTFTYQKNSDSTYTITGYNPNTYNTTLHIPEYYNNSHITAIGKSAFAHSKFDTVYIFNNINIIGSKAFYNCQKLSTVTIPYSVTNIGEMAFYNCGSLTSITIGNRVTSIGERAFYNCYNLNTVYYTGTEYEWGDISIYGENFYLTDATRYYYSESEPTEAGNFWHYVDGVPTKWE